MKWRNILSIGAIIAALVLLGGSAHAASPQWEALPEPLTNIRVTSGSGHSQWCYRTTKGSKSRYFCRDIVSDGWNGIWEIPQAGSTATLAAPGNYSITYRGPAVRSIDGVSSASPNFMYESLFA